MVQDTLRGSGPAAVPFFDQGKVVRLLDRLPGLEPGDQVAIDQILMILLSATRAGRTIRAGRLTSRGPWHAARYQAPLAA